MTLVNKLAQQMKKVALAVNKKAQAQAQEQIDKKELAIASHTAKMQAEHVKTIYHEIIKKAKKVAGTGWGNTYYDLTGYDSEFFRTIGTPAINSVAAKLKNDGFRVVIDNAHDSTYRDYANDDWINQWTQRITIHWD